MTQLHLISFSDHILTIMYEEDSTQIAAERFACDCGRSYKRKGDFNRHKKEQCGKEGQFRCMHCSYASNFKTNLERHIRAKHLNICETENWTGQNKRFNRYKLDFDMYFVLGILILVECYLEYYFCFLFFLRHGLYKSLFGIWKTKLTHFCWIFLFQMRI